MKSSATTLLLITVLLVASLGSTLANVSADYTFSTNDAFVGQRHHHRKKTLRRKEVRRALAAQTAVSASGLLTTSHVTSLNVKPAASQQQRPAARAADELAKEDKAIWNRLLDEEMSMNTRAPTFSPVASPPTGDGENGGGGSGNCPTTVSWTLSSSNAMMIKTQCRRIAVPHTYYSPKCVLVSF